MEKMCRNVIFAILRALLSGAGTQLNVEVASRVGSSGEYRANVGNNTLLLGVRNEASNNVCNDLRSLARLRVAQRVKA